jgi:putative RNA 2'-phosphotransferase
MVTYLVCDKYFINLCNIIITKDIWDYNMETKNISKFMSLVLRHKPEKIGLVLDKNGWASVAELLVKMNITRQQLDAVIEEQKTDNIRFALSEDGTRIRANQGHSLGDIDLNLKVVVPTQELYHGTPDKNVASIQKLGLMKTFGINKRHDVHLSVDVEKALVVAKRRKGEPVILVVDAVQMHQDGYVFKISENGVWLTDHVPPKYLSIR